MPICDKFCASFPEKVQLVENMRNSNASAPKIAIDKFEKERQTVKVLHAFLVHLYPPLVLQLKMCVNAKLT